jgi:hypothetical protein
MAAAMTITTTMAITMTLKLGDKLHQFKKITVKNERSLAANFAVEATCGHVRRYGNSNWDEGRSLKFSSFTTTNIGSK